MDVMRQMAVVERVTPVALGLSVFWVILGLRLAGLLALAAVAALYFRCGPAAGSKPLIVAWAIFLLTMVSPLDISVRNVPGGPRIVPFVMGLPSPVGRQMEARGDIAFGSCVRSGLEPKWVIVW
jgi:hypothetical protein